VAYGKYTPGVCDDQRQGEEKALKQHNMPRNILTLP